MCVLWTNIWGPVRGPHYEGLLSNNYILRGLFLWGRENVPIISTDPTLLVCFHMNVPVSVQR